MIVSLITSGLSESHHNCGSEREKKCGTNQSGSHSARIRGGGLEKWVLIPSNRYIELWHLNLQFSDYWWSVG